MKRSEMFEKVVTELFVQLAARRVPPLPVNASDEEADEVMKASAACAKQALVAASALMVEYRDVEDAVALADEAASCACGAPEWEL